MRHAIYSCRFLLYLNGTSVELESQKENMQTSSTAGSHWTIDGSVGANLLRHRWNVCISSVNGSADAQFIHVRSEA